MMIQSEPVATQLPVFIMPLPINPHDQVPDQATFESADEQTIVLLQEKTHRALLNPGRSLHVIQIYGMGVIGLLNYGAIYECQCVFPLCRFYNRNARTEFSLSILSVAMQLASIKKDEPLRIGVIGAGALLNELFLLALLVQNNIKKIHFDLSDLFYGEPIESSKENEDPLHSKKNLRRLTTEFLTVAHYGFGLSILSNKKKGEDRVCTTMSDAVCDFSEKSTVVKSKMAVGSMSVNFFSSAENYARELSQEEKSKPDIIYDIDIEPVENREPIITPVKKMARNGCVWLSAIRASNDVVIQSEKKDEKEWVQQSHLTSGIGTQ
jgi:hypothetical protein